MTTKLCPFTCFAAKSNVDLSLVAAAAIAGAELGQHAAGRFRVEESDLLTARSGYRGLIQKSDTGFLGLCQLGHDVIGHKSDVVDAAFGVLFQKFGNRALRRGRLKQFNMHTVHIKKGYAYLLGGDFLDMLTGQAEGFFVISDAFVEGRDGDAEVVDMLDHGEGV